jgi:hypothetical protein
LGNQVLSIMKKSLAILILTFCVTALAQETTSALPKWLQSKISEYESMPPSNPPRSVHQSTYEGKTVYYIPPICCDIQSELYDEAGNRLCAPDGGFTGRGDGRCKLFNVGEAMSFTIWQDSRTPAIQKRKTPEHEQ